MLRTIAYATTIGATIFAGGGGVIALCCESPSDARTYLWIWFALSVCAALVGGEEYHSKKEDHE